MDENSPPVAPNTAPGIPYPPIPAKKGPNKAIIAVVIIVIAVLIVAAVGMTMLNAAGKVKSTPAEMKFKLADFPSGWHASGTTLDMDEVPGIERSYSVFNNSVTGVAAGPMAEVSCQIMTYTSVSHAKVDFATIFDNFTAYTMTEVSDHFEQCQLVTISNYIGEVKGYLFQQKNVCGVIVFSAVWGYDLDQVWIDEMLDLQESRIV